jgi:hypothetical protein
MGVGVEFEVAAADVKEGLRDALDTLLGRAHSADAVRLDVTALMVMSLVAAPARPLRMRARRPPAICSRPSATGWGHPEPAERPHTGGPVQRPPARIRSNSPSRWRGFGDDRTRICGAKSRTNHNTTAPATNA